MTEAVIIPFNHDSEGPPPDWFTNLKDGAVIAQEGNPQKLRAEVKLQLGPEEVIFEHIGDEGSEFHFVKVKVDGVEQFKVPEGEIGFLIALPPNTGIGLRIEHK